MINGIKVKPGYYVTAERYAQIKGISPSTVRRRCVRGELTAYKFSRSWWVRMEDKR